MKPSDAADELHEHKIFVPIRRLAGLLSVMDDRPWSPDDEAGLKGRLADYMATNHVSSREMSDQSYL